MVESLTEKYTMDGSQSRPSFFSKFPAPWSRGYLPDSSVNGHDISPWPENPFKYQTPWDRNAVGSDGHDGSYSIAPSLSDMIGAAEQIAQDFFSQVASSFPAPSQIPQQLPMDPRQAGSAADLSKRLEGGQDPAVPAIPNSALQGDAAAASIVGAADAAERRVEEGRWHRRGPRRCWNTRERERESRYTEYSRNFKEV